MELTNDSFFIFGEVDIDTHVIIGWYLVISMWNLGDTHQKTLVELLHRGMNDAPCICNFLFFQWHFYVSAITTILVYFCQGWNGRWSHLNNSARAEQQTARADWIRPEGIVPLLSPFSSSFVILHLSRVTRSSSSRGCVLLVYSYLWYNQTRSVLKDRRAR